MDDENETTEVVETAEGPGTDVLEAKIAELEGIIASHASEVEALTTALTVAKAANYDLLTQVGTNTEADVVADDETDVELDDLLFQDED